MRGAQAGGFLQVLDADRQAVQRGQRVAARDRRVGLLRGGAGARRSRAPTIAFTAWSIASMRAMQLSSSSEGARRFCPIRRRASTAVRSQGSVMWTFFVDQDGSVGDGEGLANGGSPSICLHRTTAPPHHRTTAPPHHRTTAPPHHRTTAPPRHRDTAMSRHRGTTVGRKSVAQSAVTSRRSRPGSVDDLKSLLL